MKNECDEHFISFLDTPRGKKTEIQQQVPVNIQEDYILTEMSQKKKDKPTYEPKLYEQLIIKDKQRSYFYNTIILAFFNINIYHFCFPYITNKVGLLLALIILVICGFCSYIIQSSIIKYVSRSSEYSAASTFSGIIQNHFGLFCAGLYELLLIVWYAIIIVVCLSTCNISHLIIVKHLVFFLLSDIIGDYKVYATIGFYVIMFIVLLSLNKLESYRMVDFNVCIVFGTHTISLIVSIMVKLN
jgi:hypothetical protein